MCEGWRGILRGVQSKLSIFKPSFAATMQEDVPEQNKKYEVRYF